MFLFILESIGTSELLLVGVVALIFLGPRRMPEMARKIGKMMAEFRGTANEFKQTWQREVDFESEIKSFDPDAIEAESKSVPRVASINPPQEAASPEIKEVDPAALERLRQKAAASTAAAAVESEPVTIPPPASDAMPGAPQTPDNDKRNWL